MTIDFSRLFFLGLLTAAIHWFVARSEIAAPLWSRARGWFDRLLRCPACSGFWLGLLLYFAGIHVVSARYRLTEFVANGFLALFITPIFEGALLWGLQQSAIERAAETSAESGATSVDPKLTSTGEVTPVDRPKPPSSP